MAISADDAPPQGLLSLDLTQAVALQPNNFTSLTRTPWAGQALAKGIKKRHASSTDQRIGESWEFSCDPEAPSKLLNTPDATLADLIACRTSECISGNLVAAGRTTCDILVKLINPSSPLSLQIHPSDDNKLLKPSECGKPESWLVLSCDKGSGLYIGFSRHLEKTDIQRLLETDHFSADLLHFVPVKPGDFFEIEPHVPHAIGPGVVLLEPQRVIAGKSGKTWRMWDWNRKYNPAGQEDPTAGRPRQLHIKEAVSLLTPESQVGSKYSDSLKRAATKLNPQPGVSATVYPPNSWYQVIIVDLAPSASVKISSKACFAGCMVLDGVALSASQFGRKIPMQSGDNFFIPAAALPNTLSTSSEGPACIALVIPAGKGVPSHNGDIFQ